MEHLPDIGHLSEKPNPADDHIADRWLVRVKGTVSVEIADGQGRRLGPDRERSGLFTITIPGATYRPGLTFTSAFFALPSVYTFTLLGQQPSAVDVYLTRFTARTKLDTVFFHAIPMTKGSRASFVYNTADPLERIVIILTGVENQQKVPPTALLNSRESADDIPPRTTLAIQNGQVIVSATDNPDGSGVLRTLYTTDARTFSVYREPFPLPPDAKLVMAFSVDGNGNQEYPGAVLPVLGVTPTSVSFTAQPGGQSILSQQVSITNLDPIHVTGQLEWEASMDVSWLSVTPAAGKTPDQIILAADTSNLVPGTYTGTVVVTSPTPATVFAQRAITVELIVEQSGTPSVG